MRGREKEEAERRSKSERAAHSSMLIAAYLAIWATAGGGASHAIAEVTVRDPGTYVVDRARIVNPQVAAQLEGWLRELEQKTGA